MKLSRTQRGFALLTHPAYPPCDGGPEPRLAQESSAVGGDDAPDAIDRPGSSYLWVGDHHHLSRAEVAELVRVLTRWVESGQMMD